MQVNEVAAYGGEFLFETEQFIEFILGLAAGLAQVVELPQLENREGLPVLFAVRQPVEHHLFDPLLIVEFAQQDVLFKNEGLYLTLHSQLGLPGSNVGLAPTQQPVIASPPGLGGQYGQRALFESVQLAQILLGRLFEFGQSAQQLVQGLLDLPQAGLDAPPRGIGRKDALVFSLLVFESHAPHGSNGKFRVFRQMFTKLAPNFLRIVMRYPTYALITGGSHGIGRAMASECARKGMGILIVALPNGQLQETLQELRQQYPEVPVHGLGLDLREPDAAERTVEWVREHQFTVQYLINNVGFGRGGLFENTPLQDYRDMVLLNNQFLVSLTYLLLPLLLSHGKAHILNVSSMEATMPLPYKTVYTGTKGFIYSFSLALREELRDRGVQVSVLCPGPVLTNEDGLRRIQAQGKRSQLLLMYPPQVAAIAIAGMLDGKTVIIPGRMNYTIVKTMRLLPTGMKMRILERIFRKYKYE